MEMSTPSRNGLSRRKHPRHSQRTTSTRVSCHDGDQLKLKVCAVRRNHVERSVATIHWGVHRSLKKSCVTQKYHHPDVFSILTTDVLLTLIEHITYVWMDGTFQFCRLLQNNSENLFPEGMDVARIL